MEETNCPIIDRYRQEWPCDWNRRPYAVGFIHRAAIHKAYR